MYVNGKRLPIMYWYLIMGFEQTQKKGAAYQPICYFRTPSFKQEVFSSHCYQVEIGEW